MHFCRMIRYEPLLGMATIGLTLDVPVVSLESLLQFFDGKQIKNQEDKELLKRFCQSCYERHMFVNKGGVDGGDYGMPNSDPIPYITSPGSWDSAGGGPLREKIFVNQSDAKAATDVLFLLSKKLYTKNEKALVSPMPRERSVW